MNISYDPAKRLATLADRGLDFDDAADVFAGATYRREDRRRDYGERRVVAFGMLRGRMVVLVYTDRSDERHIISMRKANERERQRYQDRLD